MDDLTYKFVVICAGLAGLTIAHKLYQAGETNLLVLESRDRWGGRIITKNNIDFGATWFHNHHTQVNKLLDELKLKKFHQFNEGKSVLVYNSMAPAHYFENDQSVPAAYRICGGSSALIKKLAAPFQDKIKLQHTVTAINDHNGNITIKTDCGVFLANQVIMAIPPRIATRIAFNPALPPACTEAMNNTHTWMSNAIKIGIKYNRPFWKEKNMSGMLIGQVGPVVELYDHSDDHNKNFALMGFINEALRDYSPSERKIRILSYLQKYLGKEIMDYIHYEETDWSKDKNTSCEIIKSIYMSPVYGNPEFERAYMQGKLFFSGAETSSIHGGYMDGAIISALKTFQKIAN